MNLLREEARSLCVDVARFAGAKIKPGTEAWVAPPFTSIEFVAEQLRGTKVRVGGQNVHWKESGAFTGEISAAHLLEAGATFAICGHSERRQYFGETDAAVAMRAAASLQKGLKTIICIGETLEQYREGKTPEVIERQLRGSLPADGIKDKPADFVSENLLVAYEPVWAIGTGLAATPEIARAVHAQIRTLLSELVPNGGVQVPILYGGSTTPDNIAELIAQPDVNGALIGGASLKADTYTRLILAGQS